MVHSTMDNRRTCEGGVKFDTDPCAPMVKPYEIAGLTYNKQQNGLDKEWVGNVWLNPPYSHPLIEKFVMRLAAHGNGILLTFDRCDNGLWQKVIFPSADGVFFMKGRVKFVDESGEMKAGAGCGSVLVAFGQKNVNGIINSGIEGTMLYVRR